MKKADLKLAAIVLGGLLIAGCGTLPVVPHAIKCEVSDQLLAGKCAAPKPVSIDTTYAKLVETMQADRKSLQECGLSADALREAIKRCNAATDEYNRKIDIINGAK